MATPGVINRDEAHGRGATNAYGAEEPRRSRSVFGFDRVAEPDMAHGRLVGERELDGTIDARR